MKGKIERIVERYNPHIIKLSDKYIIESTTHNSYVLKEVGIQRTGKNAGETTYKDIAFGDVPHLVRRFVEETMHDDLAGKEITLKEYVDKYEELTDDILNILEENDDKYIT